MNDIIKFQNETTREVIINSKLQIFEVKQIIELEDKYKKQCKLALLAYRCWQKQYSAETDVIELLYSQLKGIVLRRNAENTVRAYWIVRQDFRAVFQHYLSQNSTHQSYSNNKIAA